MSEQDAHPIVSPLLEVLREQAGQLDGEVRVYETSLVERISDGMARLPEPSAVWLDKSSLIEILREQASQLVSQVRFQDIGIVQQVGNGVATLSGLPRARTEELVTFPTGVQGMVLDLDHMLLDVILLGADEGIQGGDLVTGSGERLRVPVGPQLLGRVLNPLGEPLDEQGPVDADAFHYLERDAPRLESQRDDWSCRLPPRTATAMAM